ncbi:MAG TPA: hypothetical protein VEH79_06220 [Gaiellaceae bacterium]|nr:hypothetical protein [Gaiellaceae bacterium]
MHGNRVAREAGASVVRREPPARTLYYQYVAGWRGPDGAAPDAAEFSLRGDELAYAFPCDAGLTCVAVSATQSEFPALRAAPCHELMRRLHAHPQFAGRVARSKPVGRTAGGPPEASWVRETHGAGWALLGDAALHQDPWTGRGMDMASVHATFLAEAIVDWLSERATEDEALGRYRQLRDDHALGPFEETVTFARDLSRLGTEGAPRWGSAVCPLSTKRMARASCTKGTRTVSHRAARGVLRGAVHPSPRWW